MISSNNIFTIHIVKLWHVVGSQFLPSLNKNSCQVHVCLLFLEQHVHLLALRSWPEFKGAGLSFRRFGMVFSLGQKTLAHSGLSRGVSWNLFSCYFSLTLVTSWSTFVSSWGLQFCKEDAADHLTSVVTRSTESDDLPRILAPEGVSTISNSHRSSWGIKPYHQHLMFANGLPSVPCTCWKVGPAWPSIEAEQDYSGLRYTYLAILDPSQQPGPGLAFSLASAAAGEASGLFASQYWHYPSCFRLSKHHQLTRDCRKGLTWTNI